MAIEGVNTAGMAYQGSSQKSAVDANGNVDAGSTHTISNVDSSAIKDSGSIKPKQELSIDDGKDAAENKLQSPTEALKKAVEEINKKATSSEAIFGIHDATNRVTIKIVDKDTREVIKEYPPEKTLDMIAKVWELAGLLVDEKG